MKRICATAGCGRPAVYLSRAWGVVRADDEHDLCPKCHQAAIEQSFARMRANEPKAA